MLRVVDVQHRSPRTDLTLESLSKNKPRERHETATLKADVFFVSLFEFGNSLHFANLFVVRLIFSDSSSLKTWVLCSQALADL